MSLFHFIPIHFIPILNLDLDTWSSVEKFPSNSIRPIINLYKWDIMRLRYDISYEWKKEENRKKNSFIWENQTEKIFQTKLLKYWGGRRQKLRSNEDKKKNGKNILLFLTSDIFKSKKYFTIFIFRFWIFKEFLMWSDLMFHHACIVIFRHCSIDLKFNIFSSYFLGMGTSGVAQEGACSEHSKKW